MGLVVGPTEPTTINMDVTGQGDQKRTGQWQGLDIWVVWWWEMKGHVHHEHMGGSWPLEAKGSCRHGT